MAFVRDVAPWTWWITLTFRRWVPRDRARAALRSFFRGVARDLVGDHVMIAWVLEPNRNGVDHAHALLAVPDGRVLDRSAAGEWGGVEAGGVANVVTVDGGALAGGAFDQGHGRIVRGALYCECNINCI